jgi:lipopolysaccharide biosynthesis glycosyltransferase
MVLIIGFIKDGNVYKHMSKDDTPASNYKVQPQADILHYVADQKNWHAM